MRIAYIAPYQGPSLVAQRPVVKNRSMSARVKIELVAQLLRRNGHEVDVISQGEVVEHALSHYRSFSEAERFHPDIPIQYASALPIRRLNGLWSSWHTLRLMTAGNSAAPYDVVVIFNMKQPQLACGRHAIRHFRVPVVLEYEDDSFVNVVGHSVGGIVASRHRIACEYMLKSVAGCIGVSPRLLAQLPPKVPKLLLRGVVGDDIARAAEQWRNNKQNTVLFAGTHIESNGVAQLIDGWRMLNRQDWKLHITGFGQETPRLRNMAENVPGIVFHGLVSREEVVQLMCTARICVNPHSPSAAPGNVFAFKLIEYLAAGAHVVTTQMGTLEPELEIGVTYMADNTPATIASTLERLIGAGTLLRSAAPAATQQYGTAAVAASLDKLLCEVVANNR